MSGSASERLSRLQHSAVQGPNSYCGEDFERRLRFFSFLHRDFLSYMIHNSPASPLITLVIRGALITPLGGGLGFLVNQSQ